MKKDMDQFRTGMGHDMEIGRLLQDIESRLQVIRGTIYAPGDQVAEIALLESAKLARKLADRLGQAAYVAKNIIDQP